MSERVYARPVFDRKKEIAKKGFGKVEILVTLSRDAKKYFAVCKCTALEWAAYQTNPELVMKVTMLNDVAVGMAALAEPMTIENLEAHLNLSDVKSEKKKRDAEKASPHRLPGLHPSAAREGEVGSQDSQPQGAGDSHLGGVRTDQALL